MKRISTDKVLLLCIFVILLFFCLYFLFFLNMARLQVIARPAQFLAETLVLDAGHGGEDGGAVSPRGTVESGINLAIVQRLDGIMGLYGANVLLLRDEDRSLHDEGAKTLRQKKVSDLHRRVALVEAAPNATLVSIHQNSFTNSSYHGSQVFYAKTAGSAPFAQYTQGVLRAALDAENERVAAKIPESVYLMKQVTCRAILVECGFLTNKKEDKILQTAAYQTKIAVALAAACLTYRENPA